MYIRKTIDEYRLYINYGYGHGYEHELTEYSIIDILQRKKEYRDNCPEYPTIIKKVRVSK